MAKSLCELKKLNTLNLELNYNNLGENPLNMKYLTNGIKNIPNLEHLSVDFSSNQIVHNFV